MNRLWEKYDGFIFDMDGTIYIEEEIIEGAVETLNFLIKQNKHLLFVTNKTTQYRKDYANFLISNGVEISSNSILTATDNIVNYLTAERMGKKFFAIAETKFIEKLLAESYGQNSELEFSDNPEEIELIIITLDRNYTEKKFEIAAKALLNGAEFFAANIDSTCPIIEGEINDAGLIISDLEKRTGKRLKKHFGKPSRTMIEVIKKKMQYKKSCYLLLGDRLETDILMGNKMGVDTALVRSGIVNDFNRAVAQPTYNIESIKDIL
ncbi:MAG: HAD-IIA family hydrolase [Melioribacteraceae bacterium]|nr:HAD-IIA family hydrolase [Melioribacteraceae bacterium]